MENKKKKRPMRYKNLFKGASLILAITSIVFLVMLIKVDIIPIKYIVLLIVGIALIEAFIIFIMTRRLKLFIKIPFLIVSFVISGIFIFGIYNLNLATTFVSNIVGMSEKEEIYNIYALNSSEIESIDDLDKTKLGVFDNGNETLEEALRLLNGQATFKSQNSYDDIEAIIIDMTDKKIDVMYISSSLSELMNEQYDESFSSFKLIGTITVKFEEKIEKSDIDVTNEPFVVYVSGIDTYGSIGTVSRSDVNILIAVNPKSGEILLINTPRDYYVKLHSKKAYDKLTHAGIYGVEESMNTLSDLYATDVDFYLKINFSSLVKLVDAIGGITVDSKYSFSYDGFTFKKGSNKLSGKAALAFSRYRKGLPNGDISRGENQEAVIEAIIEKIVSPSIISKYSSILSTMSKSFVTNMSEEDIYDLAKYQLDKSPNWSITSKNPIGRDSYETTYSAGKTKLYVMLPDEESLTEAKQELNRILTQ